MTTPSARLDPAKAEPIGPLEVETHVHLCGARGSEHDDQVVDHRDPGKVVEEFGYCLWFYFYDVLVQKVRIVAGDQEQEIELRSKGRQNESTTYFPGAELFSLAQVEALPTTDDRRFWLLSTMWRHGYKWAIILPQNTVDGMPQIYELTEARAPVAMPTAQAA